MNRNFLEKFNLEKDVIDAIMDEHGKGITREQNRKTALQSKYDDLKEAYDKVKDVDVESITKESEEWKEKFETLEKNVANEKAEKSFNDFLDGSFKKFKVKDDIAVKAHLDISKLKDIKKDEDKTKELESQLTEIQKKSAFLFDEVKEEKNNNPNPYNYSPQGGNEGTSNSMEAQIDSILNNL